jgi:hypothetical protein
MIARIGFVTAALLAATVSLTAQTKTTIGNWYDWEIDGLAYYYTSHEVCGFPLTEKDRDVLVQAYAKINELSVEDARVALDQSPDKIEPGGARKMQCDHARQARLKAINALRSTSSRR